MWWRAPKLTVVVIAYNMSRELPRTLTALTPEYQQVDRGSTDYEVLVIDNGSNPPCGEDFCKRHPGFHYHYIKDAAGSPARALNVAARMARGEILGFLVDGARLVTPGVLRSVASVFRAFPDPMVAIPGWHLGHEPQQFAVLKGYDQQQEDGLLDSIGWPAEGYRLFDVGVPAASWERGCLADIPESNAMFLTKKTFKALGGFDERFDLPGGGLLNLDFYFRVATHPGVQVVVLPGEGTFHQIHGGISTNVPHEKNLKQWDEWEAQYRLLTGHPYQPARVDPVILGKIPPQALSYLAFSANRARELALLGH
jgi:glycosyltransferase involved in cell wall biosynthesis